MQGRCYALIASTPCLDPCVFLLQCADNSGTALWAGDKGRLIVLDDVDGETVIIEIVGGPAEKFEGLLPKAQEVLNAVEWEATS